MTPTPRPMPLRILLVEDSDADARTLMDLASDAGYGDSIDWTHARSPTEALSILRREGRTWRTRGPIHALIVDQYMGVESGVDLLREIKADPLLSAAAVVIISSSDDIDTIDAAYSAGACGWIVKVGDAQAYREAVTTLLDLWLQVMELVEI